MSLLGQNAPESLILCTSSSCDLFVNHHLLSKEASPARTESCTHLCYPGKYGGGSLLLCSFSRTVGVDSPLGPRTCLAIGSQSS